MSNKLTREVKYLNESDRPKKVEPLEFYEWLRLAGWVITSRDGDIVRWRDDQLRQAVSKYATYLQEFSAEEVPVKFTKRAVNPAMGEFETTLAGASEYDTVIYKGKIHNEDYFIAFDNDSTTVGFFKGHINSGKF